MNNNEQRKENNQVNEQENKHMNQVDVENKKEKGRGTFYGIIAFAVFIIMAVGATFAYFTASTNSSSGSVQTGSASLQLEYISYNDAWLSDKLIPVKTNIVEYSVEQRPDSSGNQICIDDYGNQICSAYVFQVRNNANSPQNVSINLASDENGFGNLTAMIYEISKGQSYVETASDDDPNFATDSETYEDGEHVQVQDATGAALYEFEPVYINRLGVTKTLLSVGTVKSVAVPVPQVGENNAKLADNIELPGVSSGNNLKSFLVVLYINENEENQNDTDSNKTFSGRIIVDGSDGATGVTGKISALDTSVLQNQTTTTTETTDTTEVTTEP